MNIDNRHSKSKAVSALEYASILKFYAEQMHHLDSLDVESYASTFTRCGIIEHRYSDQIQSGGSEILAYSKKMLQSYRFRSVRHWNGGYFVQSVVSESPGQLKYKVQYASLVTHKEGNGATGIAFIGPFIVTDFLVLEKKRLRVKHRTIELS